MAIQNQIIQYLPADHYIEFLRGASDGVSGSTHLANVQWEDGVERESWVKLYAGNKPRSLVNEMIGYLLGRALDLPMPPKAGFLLIETKVLNPNFVHLLSDVDRYRGFTFAWVTEDVKGENLRIEIKNNPINQNIMIDYFKECMRDWGQLCNLIAFDDWILNSDRNMGNSIHLPDRTFCLIDHGECMNGGDWKESQLLNPDCVHVGFAENIHLRLLYEKHKSAGLFQLENTMTELDKAKQEHFNAIKLVKSEIQEHLNDLIGDELIDTGIDSIEPYPVTETVLNFLINRAQHVEKFNERCDTFFSIQSLTRPMS